MKMFRLAVPLGTAIALLVLAAQAADALPPRDPPIYPPPRHCPAGSYWDDDLHQCVRPPLPPPPAGHAPVLFLDAAQQTHARDGIHVWGWTADEDSPGTALQTQLSVDGAVATTITADVVRPDVAAVFPQFGAAHGYDLILPASTAAHRVCVSAVGVANGPDSSACAQMDDILEFDSTTVSYDLAHAQITSTPTELDHVSQTNRTSVPQSTEISGSNSVAETHGWTDTVGVRVTISGSVGIPILLDAELTVEGSFAFTQNESTATSRAFNWRQPLNVPPGKTVVATILVVNSVATLPYSLAGDYVYRSGKREPDTVTGTYSGMNSHGVYSDVEESNLDGSPAAHPVPQPQPSSLSLTGS